MEVTDTVDEPEDDDNEDALQSLLAGSGGGGGGGMATTGGGGGRRSSGLMLVLGLDPESDLGPRPNRSRSRPLSALFLGSRSLV